jgi:hypothetical protein
MKKLSKEAGIVVDAKVANNILAMIRSDRSEPSTEWPGVWNFKEIKYFSLNPTEDPDAKDRAEVIFERGSKTLTLPLYAIASARVVPGSPAGGTEYEEGHRIYRTSQLKAIKEESVQFKSLLNDGELIIPKEINIDAIEVRENMDGEIIVNSRYIDGYFAWASAKMRKTGEWPSIIEYQAAIGKKTDRDPDLTFEGHTLTPVKSVNKEHPQLSKCAVTLYLTDLIEEE